jgi:hypothetical protein
MSRRLFRSARSNNWAVNGFSLSVAFGSKMELGPSLEKRKPFTNKISFLLSSDDLNTLLFAGDFWLQI